MMYDYDHAMSGWGYGLMLLYMLLFWGGVVIGVGLLVRYLGGHRHDARVGAAQRILADRFARGEIDEDEFRRRTQALYHGGRSTAG